MKRPEWFTEEIRELMENEVQESAYDGSGRPLYLCFMAAAIARNVSSAYSDMQEMLKAAGISTAGSFVAEDWQTRWDSYNSLVVSEHERRVIWLKSLKDVEEIVEFNWNLWLAL